MWFHNKNRYQTPEARAKYGLAAVLARKFGYYFAAAAGLYALTEVIPPAFFPTIWLTASCGASPSCTICWIRRSGGFEVIGNWPLRCTSSPRG